MLNENKISTVRHLGEWGDGADDSVKQSEIAAYEVVYDAAVVESQPPADADGSSGSLGSGSGLGVGDGMAAAPIGIPIVSSGNTAKRAPPSGFGIPIEFGELPPPIGQLPLPTISGSSNGSRTMPRRCTTWVMCVAPKGIGTGLAICMARPPSPVQVLRWPVPVRPWRPGKRVIWPGRRRNCAS